MTYPTETARKRNNKTVVATVRLARWQLRAAWGLLVMTGIGIVAAVMLVCAVPLYANVAMSAGLRGVLTASPQNTVIVVRSNSLRASAQYISKVGRHLDQELEKNLGPYLGSPQFSIETKPFLIPENKATKGLHVTNEILLSVLTRSSDEAASRGQFFAPGPDIIWYYPLDPARIGISDLDTIINGVESVKVDNANNPDLDQPPLLENTLTYQQSDILEQYRSRTSVAQLPVTGLLLLMLGLILFFMSMMADLLIERQADAIAILHSRGASRRQIFGSLMIQSITLGLIAFIAGPLRSEERRVGKECSSERSTYH